MAHAHLATVRWTLQDGDFAGRRYSRAHTWSFDGGLTVPASSSPSVVPLPMSDAAAVAPEEAFVAALASCHLLWFLDLAARAGWRVETYEDAASGTLGRDAQGRAWVDVVTLRPRVRFAVGHAPDEPAHVALHHAAHDACFLANSVRSEIRCEPAFA